MKKKLLTFLLIGTLIGASLCLCGCDGPKDINVEDFALSTVTEESYGKDHISQKFTNNTDYTITSFKIKYKLKDGVKDEDLNVFKEIKKYEKADASKLKSITMTCDSKKVCDPKKSVTQPLFAETSSYYILTQAQYDLMQLASIEFSYIATDGKIYTTTYDYATKEYNKGEDGKIAKKVPEGPLASKVPVPDLAVIETSSDDEKSVSMDAYGADETGYQNYLEKVKTAGFTQKSKTDTMYNGTDSEGNELSVWWKSDENSLDIHFHKAKSN